MTSSRVTDRRPGADPVRASTSLYHFLFVPLTLGLAPLVAIMQTLWHRTGVDAWLRLTRFFGTLLLINFAIGVATGLVQEFQFGMNWSVYSAFVGDVFGAPLAIEGLAAFSLEAMFLGLWIFGWDRLPPRVHLATIWIVAVGHVAVGVLHPGRELVDAVPGRLRAGAGGRGRSSRRRGSCSAASFALHAWLHTMLAGAHGRLGRGLRRLAAGTSRAGATSSCSAARRRSR